MDTKTILIADNDQDCLFQMELYVKDMGYTVIKAESQKEAEEVLRTSEPDLCIFDLMMENKDSGFVLSYKSKKQNPERPVIIVSAVNSETGMSFSTESDSNNAWIQADLFLEKNIRKEQLQREIHKLLHI